LFNQTPYRPSILARSISLVLALTFMVHSGYVNATTMECYSSGTSEVSLAQKDFCCAAEAMDFAAISKKCCGFEKSEKVFDGFLNKVETDLTPVSLLPSPLGYLRFSLPILEKVDGNSLKSPPDLRSGFALLKFISVYRL
jgi:hypothetical protein